MPTRHPLLLHSAALSKAVDAAAASARPPANATNHPARAAAARSALAAERKNVAALRAKHARLAAAADGSTQDAAAGAEAAERAAAAAAAEEPRLRHVLSLFAHISRVDWRHGAPAGRAVGTHDAGAKGGLTTLDFDESGADAPGAARAALVDAVWAVVGAK